MGMNDFAPGEGNRINEAARQGNQLADAVLAWHEALNRDPKNPQTIQGFQQSLQRWRQVMGVEDPLGG